MTAVLDAIPNAATTSGPEQSASWPARAGAFVVDVLPGLGVIATMVLLAWTAPLFGWLWWVFTAVAVLAFALMAINRALLPTTKGWSLGRALFGIRVTRRDGGEVGLWRLLVRDLAHLLDTLPLFIGWLWPLWDRRRRTFADFLLRTEVHRAERPQRDMRRPAAAALVVAALVSALAVGLGYLVVYRPDRAVDAARDQITTQGPRIVEQLLSYNKDTLADDFSRAQSLATDEYRPQLVAQQESVQQAGATSNEYWAVSSAVLSASSDKGSMLLALQGQRGTNPEELKFITATVQAEFENAGDGNWRVANLTVLKKPNMSGGAR